MPESKPIVQRVYIRLRKHHFVYDFTDFMNDSANTEKCIDLIGDRIIQSIPEPELEQLLPVLPSLAAKIKQTIINLRHLHES